MKTFCIFKKKFQILDRDKTLKGIQEVYDSITEKFFSASGPRAKHFEHLFCRLINCTIITIFYISWNSITKWFKTLQFEY